MGHWRAIHLPQVNPHPSNSLVHFILSEQEMISSCRLGPSWAEMCTKRDRAKLINSGTLSVDFINIDVCAATLFFCIFFHLFQSKEGQAKRLLFVYSHCCSKKARNMHSSSYVIITRITSEYFRVTIHIFRLTMSRIQMKRVLSNTKYGMGMGKMCCRSVKEQNERDSGRSEKQINASWRCCCRGRSGLIITSLPPNHMLHIIYWTPANFTPCQTHQLQCVGLKENPDVLLNSLGTLMIPLLLIKACNASNQKVDRQIKQPNTNFAF